MSRRITVFAILTAALLGTGAGALEGRYVANGATLDFREDGVLHVAMPTGEEIQDGYLVDDETVTFLTSDDSSACAGISGVYAFTETDDALTFTVLSDECATRAEGLTAGPWMNRFSPSSSSRMQYSSRSRVTASRT